MEPLGASSRRNQIAMALLAKRQEAANSHLSVSSSRVPLVCIDLEYLQGKLEADRPVICFLNLSVFPHRFTTMDELARHFVSELSAIRREGPYHLCGYCFGGFVALEMARLLEERGDRIASLVLMEPGYPGTMPLSFWASRRLRQLVREPLPFVRYLGSKMSATANGHGNAAPAAYGDGTEALLATMDNAVSTHVFRPYRGRATILVGRESDRRFIHRVRWRRLVGGIDLRYVYGDHSERFFSEDLVAFFRGTLDR
jgi:thioesterase domain-containing protein